MKLPLTRPQGFALPTKFFQLIDAEITKANVNIQAYAALTLNFRDPNYSPIDGGYHPVEIRIEKTNDAWHLIYMTDFSYQGHPYPELTKEIDVCFVTSQLSTLFGGPHSALANKSFIKMFVSNFIEYHEMDIYEVSISTD